MAEYIAVTDVFSTIDHGSLKRQALMFDKLVIPNFRATLDGLHAKHSEKAELFAEFDWLLDHSVVVEPDIDVNENELRKNPEYREFFTYYFDHLVSMDQTFRDVTVSDLVTINNATGEQELTEKGRACWQSVSTMFGLQAREISIQLRLLRGMDAYPVLSSLIPRVDQTNKDTVTQVVLNEFPVPDEQTPWEHIEEFRTDPESRSRFFALKEWINEVARMRLPRVEVEDRLKAHIADYEIHMGTHKLNRKWDVLKIIMSADFGLLAAAKLTGWTPFITAAGVIASPLIAIKQQQIKLFQAEQQTPGREIAYIVKAIEKFEL
jgi:hypothetical protein